ncbi:acetyltransferase [Rhodobacteraceae bacterium NNCM2]|nr:acetyltransferase [Coraliihabitans acroporae]
MAAIPLDQRPLVVLGARSQAPVIADWVGDLPGVEITHFVENHDRDRCGGTILDRPVIWVDTLREMTGTHAGFCAFGSPQRRHFIEVAAGFGLPFVTPVHPSAVLSRRSEVGEGTIVSPGVIMAGFSRIGRHVLVNRGALIGHDVRIGDYVTIGPGSNIAGFCEIGAMTYIGMGAKILDRIKVGENCVIGAGAVVTRDVPDNTKVIGVPARAVGAK